MMVAVMAFQVAGSHRSCPFFIPEDPLIIWKNDCPIEVNEVGIRCNAMRVVASGTRTLYVHNMLFVFFKTLIR